MDVAVNEDQVERVRVRLLPDGRMTRADAARYLGKSLKTLEWWAHIGTGPDFVKVGGRAFYFQEALDRFIRGEVAA